MPELNEFKIFLRKENGNYYYIDSSGNLADQSAQIELQFAPEGWDATELKWVRGFTFYGVITNMTNPYKFVKDGAKILRSIYFTSGVNGFCELYIERKNANTKTYSKYFSGELDFSRLVDEEFYVTCTAMDGSYMEKLKAKEDTTYEIDIDTHPDYFYIKMDGITLKSKIDFLTITEPGPTFPTDMFDNVRFDQFIRPTVVFFQGDTSGIVGVPSSQNLELGPFVVSTMNFDNTNFFFKSTATSTFDIATDFRVALRNDGVGGGAQDPIKLEVRLLTITETGGINSTVLFTTPTFQPNNGSTTIYNINFTTTGLFLIKGIKVGLSLNVITAAGISHQNWEYDLAIEEGTISMEFETKLPESYIKALHPEKVFDSLVDSISENTVGKEASVLVTNKQMAVTSFDAVRGLDGSKIKTTFNDFFDSYTGILSLGTYYDKINNEHVIDNIANLYDSTTNMFDIGAVASATFEPLTEQMYSSFNIGYPEFNIEGLNGKEAFNTKFEFSTPITRTQNKKNYSSIYIASAFAIELTRANLDGKTSTSNDTDNDNCIIYTESTPAGTYNGKDYYDLYRDPTMVITGLSFPDDMFNIPLSPKRNLLRNGALIHSFVHLMDSDYIKFQTSDRNQDLSTTLGAVTITESADVLISDLDTALFLPIVATIKCLVPIDIQSILDTNPYGYLSFSWDGDDFKGFLLEASETPVSKASQELKLLLTQDTDITKLIK